MGKKILQAREFGEASPGVQKEERIGDIGAKGNGSFNLKSLDQSEIIGATGCGMFHGRAGEERGVLEVLEEPEL